MPKKPGFKDITPILGAVPTRLEQRFEVQYARLLGMTVAAWAYAEEALTLILATLLGVDHTRAKIIFYASKSEQFRGDLIRQLAKQSELGDTLYKRLNDNSQGLHWVGWATEHVHSRALEIR